MAYIHETKTFLYIYKFLGTSSASRASRHLPERWGYIRFSEHKPGEGPADPGTSVRLDSV